MHPGWNSASLEGNHNLPSDSVKVKGQGDGRFRAQGGVFMVVLGGQREWEQKKSSLWVVSQVPLPEGYKGVPGNSASEMGWMNENVMGMISVWHQILDFTTSASQETLRSRGALPEWLTGAPAINAH